MMMVTARTVDVTVGQFFAGGIADSRDFDGEVQGEAGHRMVAVQNDFVAVHVDDRDQLHAPGRLRLELHPGENLGGAMEGAFWHGLHHLVIAFAIAVGGRYRNLEGVAHRVARQGAFEAWDDVAQAVEVGKWFLPLGTVEDFSFITGEGVMDADNFVCGDLHEFLWSRVNQGWHDSGFPGHGHFLPAPAPVR